ncbi:MAG: Sporulation initiation inhibitor protein Soj [Deltaproteobacteria bacterium ADurb.Bin135]|nr:MAG: Sporulation initiation inhibitor protein Soj [Deltaproteobacteria bacterium ADurb.Bin135]
MATVVSFINFKGGVGKTTLCVEIAASLAQKFNEKVLIVDLDPQTNATLSLMTEKDWEDHAAQNGTLRDFFEACYEGKELGLDSIIVKNPVKYHGALTNLDLVPSHIELFGMDLRLATKLGHENLKAKLFLKKALEPLQDKYTYIFVDCPPNLYLTTQNGLFASDHYLIVALAEYLSTLGIAHIQKSVGNIFADANKLLSDIGSGTNGLKQPAIAGIIFNRLRTIYSGTYSQEDIIRRVTADYPGMVFDARVPHSDKIAVRAEQKVPIAVSGYAADRAYEERITQAAHEFYDRLTRPTAGRS